MFHPLFIVALGAAFVAPNSSLLRAAANAGREIAPIVFQNNRELRVCLAEAERDLQICQQQEQRNCDGVFESTVNVCRARHPEVPAAAPPPPAPAATTARQDDGNGALRKYLLWGGAIIVTLYIISWARAEAALNDIYDDFRYGANR